MKRRSVKPLSFLICLFLISGLFQYGIINASAQDTSSIEANIGGDTPREETTVDEEESSEGGIDLQKKIVEENDKDTEKNKKEQKSNNSKSKNNNIGVQANTDRSSDFKIDGLTIKLQGTTIYEYNDPNSTPAGLDLSSYGNPKMEFKLNFSQDVPSLDDFQDQDYVIFDICTIKGVTGAAFNNFSMPQDLLDKGDKLAVGVIITEDTPDGVKLKYKVTFNDKIENKNDIKGGMGGSASLIGVGEGEKVTIIREGENISTFEKTPKPTGGGLGAGKAPSPIPVPEVSKSAVGREPSNNSITWRIQLTEFAEKQFSDYENGMPTYDHMIFEEMLDMHQTFYMESYYHGGASATYNIPIYLYDKSGSSGSYYQHGTTLINLGSTSANNPMTYIDTGNYASDEATVKSTAKTWTIVKETDPDNSPNLRERMIVNFGAPGDDGLTYADIMGETDVQKLLDTFTIKADAAQKVLDDNPGANDSAALTDEYGITQSKSEWKRIQKLYSDSYDYYNVYDDGGDLTGPYVYSGYIDVKAKVKSNQIETGNVSQVKNSFRLSGGYTDKEGDSSQENFWSGYISAKASNGDVQIYKADSLYGNTQGGINGNEILGGMEGIRFEVYTSLGVGPLKFDEVSGKYEYNNASGSQNFIETNEKGWAILSKLTPGNYYFKEISSPDGYYTGQNQRIDFTISNTNIAYKLANNVARGVSLTKVDAETTSTSLDGAKFELYSYTDPGFSDAAKVTGFTTSAINLKNYYVYDGNTNTELITDSHGKLVIKNLDPGKYYLQEVEAPDGYKLSDTKHTFTLTDDLSGDPIISLGNIGNSPMSGKVSFKAEKNITGRGFTTGDEFTFELYEDKGSGYGSTPSQSKTIYPTSGSVMEVTFDAINYTSTDKDKTYNYKIVEKQGTISGIVYSQDEYEGAYKITDDGKGNLSAVRQSGDDLTNSSVTTFENVFGASGTIQLEGEKQFASGAGINLEDDQFNFEVREGNKVVSTGTNTSNGSITFTPINYTLADVGTHTYEVVEKSSTDGGIIYDTKVYEVKVEVVNNNTDTLQTNIIEINGIPPVGDDIIFTNDTTKAEILKVDENDDPLPGAKLELYNSQGAIVDQWTSTTSPHALEAKLIAGEEYTLKEVEAPKGYLLATDVMFTVPDDGQLIKVVMKDIKETKQSGKYNVKVTKFVQRDGKYASMNYTFYAALFSDKACTNRVSDVAELKLTKSYVTTAEFKNLIQGTYYIAETDKDGDALDFNDPAVFFTNEISNDTINLTPQQGTATTTITNHLDKPPKEFLFEDDGQIKINKSVVSGSKEKRVTDTFYFTLYSDVDMTNIIETRSLKLKNKSSGSVTFKDLPYGTYYIAESDKDGIPVDEGFKYTVDLDTEMVSIDSGNIVNVNITNITDDEWTEEDETTEDSRSGSSNNSNPRTGDESSAIYYMIIILCAMVVLAGILALKRKTKKE